MSILFKSLKSWFASAAKTTSKVAKTASDTIVEATVAPVSLASGSKLVPWMETAKKLMGTREIAGKRSNNKIMEWAKALGRSVSSIYTNDDIPWCGLFVAHVMNVNGIKHGFANPLGARNWLKFGVKTAPCYGAVMVFWRGKKSGWSGHVGLYVSEDDNYYHILGGNQSNSVNVTKIAKNRFLGARWPSNYPTLRKRQSGRIHKKFDGKVSINEA